MVLNKVDALEDILDELNNAGVKGATVIDSQGMARVLGSSHPEKIPLFGSLSMLINGTRPYNKTIFAVIEDKQVAEAVNAIKSVVGDLSKPNIGIVFTVPVGYAEGIHI
jgi:nitrogen regulatory protein PII